MSYAALEATMKTENGIPMNNAAVAALPKHLLQFAVDQRYDDYTPVDHAVWRFIMRQNIFFLKEYAHKVYFQGLLDTGISFERIPRISEMNDILGKIGWGAVAVDGFIPPAAFMEFQAYKVLVIACDMRQIHHIEYTPAPDIVHEAAGHAPIIVDREYSDYLQRFGEVGAKAMSSKKDFELYEAIRHLSILKELPNSDPKEVEEATRKVEERPEESGQPLGDGAAFAAALVDGGIRPDRHAGKTEDLRRRPPFFDRRIGQLSRAAREENPLFDRRGTRRPFDITTKQPQLFVCRDFQHLSDVLEEFASRMAFMVGGLEGINKAIECNNTATCEYSSGLQVSGRFTEVLTDPEDQPIYLRTTGPTALAFRDKELPGHGRDYHKDGFGSPIGKWKETEIREGRKARLEFESGVLVEGRVEKMLRRDGKLLLITFSDCTAKLGDRVLFDPAWGTYDMAVGERIASVFNGAADKDAYNQVALVPKERTIKIPSDARRRKLENLYAQMRNIRESKVGYERLGEIWETQQAEHPDDWLLSMEIFEILDETEEQPELKGKVQAFLETKKAKTKDLSTLIGWGFRLVAYHRQGLHATAQ